MGFTRLLSVCTLSSVLVACGGGGNSDSSTNTTPAPVVNTGTSSLYTGSRTAAVVTDANQKLLVAGMLNTGGRISGLVNVLNSPFGDSTARNGNPVWSLDATPTACQNGGTKQVASSFDDSKGTGEMRYTYTQCVTSTDTLNGSYLLKINKYAVSGTQYKISDVTVEYIDYTKMTGTVTDSSVGTISLKSAGDGSITATSNLLYRDSTGLQRLDTDLAFSIAPARTTIAGQLCESLNGCVTISTPVPHSSTTTSAQGQSVLTGAANAKVRYRVAGTSTALQKWMDLDANGDDTYESSVQYVN